MNQREFMEMHYKDNMPLEQLAMASVRSLSTFRRDFLKVFGTTLEKWLLKKRLKEVYRLITQYHKSPSTFLYGLGFESFSLQVNLRHTAINASEKQRCYCNVIL